MNGHIYKITPSITREEILEICEFEEVPDYGDVMTYEEFMDDVEGCCIMDYDGTGKLMLYDKVVKFTSTWIRSGAIYFKNRFIVPFDVMHSLFGDNMKIIWYNK